MILGKIKSCIEAHPLVSTLFASIAVFGAHLLTVAEYPPAWYDEIEILEIGRFSIFNVFPEWSVNLIPAQDGTLIPPCPLFHYLSGALFEALYRLTGNFVMGRIVMLASLPLCTLALFAWLREKGITCKVAFVVSLLFLVDTNATVCAHWYRPDIWCLAMVFLGSILISRSRRTACPMAMLLIGGGLGAMAIFFWITSVLLLPLMLVEFFMAYNFSRIKEKTIPTITAFGTFVLGGILATVVILLPLYRHIPDIIAQYLTRSEIATMMTATADPHAATIERLTDFIKIACRSPFVWLATFTGVFLCKRNIIHAILFATTAIFILSTRVYHIRMVYLMPYLFLFTAIAVERLAFSPQRVNSVLSRFLVMGALCFGFSISVVTINYATWPEANTLALFQHKLKDSIPATATKVCLLDFEHECYYAGRALGWKMYSTANRTEILKEPYAKFLDGMDAIIVSSALKDITNEHKNILASHGFALSTTINMPPAATGKLKSRLANIFYAHGYPACEVWKRHTS